MRGDDDPSPKEPVQRIVKRKTPGRKKKLSTTQVLPAVPPPDLDAPRPPREETQRLPKQTEGSRLRRSPLILEFVGAIAVGPSPHVSPGLIGKRISGAPSSAMDTGKVGLRSGPSGFANYGNVRKEKKKKKKKK